MDRQILFPELPLHEAAYKGELLKLKRLIRKCTDIDLKDKNGLTALMYATGGNN